MRLAKVLFLVVCAALLTAAAPQGRTRRPTPSMTPTPRIVDEYGDILVGDEKQRLDNFTKELQHDPSAQGYIVCYGGRRSRTGEAQRRCDRARNFLVNTRSMDTSRVLTVDAGYREKPVIELWLVPSGATPPAASPTIDPKDVRPPRPPRKPRRRVRR